MIFWNDLLTYSFLRNALFAAVLASVACGIIGSFVVVRRTTYVGGAIAHSVLGGMGAARYFQKVHDIQWLTPLTGATIAAVAAAVITALVTFHGRQREDTVLSAIWAIGMATGISFITATPGYHEDLMSYLFGNILMVGGSELIYMVLLDILVVASVALFYDRFLVISFQPELATLRGLKVGIYHTFLLILISLTVVLLTQVVGLVMVIALLTLPAATASQLTRRLWTMMITASLLCLFFTITGIAVSYEPELPAGATIIELTGAGYLLVMGTKWVLRKRVKSSG